MGVTGLPRAEDGIPGLGRGTAWGRGGAQETLSPRGKGLPRAGAGGRRPTQAASEAAGECGGGQAAQRRRGEARRAGRSHAGTALRGT